MSQSDDQLRENGIEHLVFIREGVVKNIARVTAGGIPDNWEPEAVPVRPEVLPLLQWRLEQIDRQLAYYRSSQPADQAPPFLAGMWAEAIDGGEEQ